jgi:hydrogenase expression/formation protein HypE
MTELRESTGAGPRPRRREMPYLPDEHVMMAHGSGGKAMHALIEAVFLPAFRNPLLDRLEDQAIFSLNGAGSPRIAFTTDSFVVSPVFFPGGDIGELAVNGTVNDLAVSGATPLCLSAGFIIEEGFPMADLRRIAASMAGAAEAAEVQIVTGDTKVVNRGKADGVFINTAGIGIVHGNDDISVANARPGDKLIVNGYVGDHGIAIMMCREDLDIEAEIMSDTAPLNSLVRAMIDSGAAIHCLRDATRGGVVTVLNEMALESELGMIIREEAVPVRQEVRAACDILGIDPLHVANEGKLIAAVAPADAEAVLEAMRAHPQGRDAAIVGEIIEEPKGRVLLQTPFGGVRVMDMLVGDPMPRIC